MELGYGSIFVDSTKTLQSNQYHLKRIETIEASNLGTAVYKFETMFDSTSNQGSLKGKSVGVEYTGTDYNTVTLSFPLYYMNLAEAKQLAEFIMTDKFEEVMTVEKDNNFLPSTYSLQQNYPNPFNPSTIIEYQIKELADVELKVFDVLGSEIMTLVDDYKTAGSYQAVFDAFNIPSGVYFYRLKANDFVETKKMILLR